MTSKRRCQCENGNSAGYGDVHIFFCGILLPVRLKCVRRNISRLMANGIILQKIHKFQVADRWAENLFFSLLLLLIVVGRVTSVTTDITVKWNQIVFIIQLCFVAWAVQNVHARVNVAIYTSEHSSFSLETCCCCCFL